MLFDFNEAWTRAVDAHYDFCICGSGPAGIITARKLAARGKKVILIEGGGLTYTEQSQNCYKGKNAGLQYWGLETGRLRYLGGTSNHWTGRCGLFDPIDFEPRSYFGRPGWPISRQDVLAGLDEATEILDIAGQDLLPTIHPKLAMTKFVQSGFALSPPTRFFEKYGDEIRQSQKIEAFYHANLVDLRLNDDLARINHVVVQNYNGRKIKVSATRYVMALGAIENARLLLHANSQIATGIGNHSGMVGRCFMEHLDVPIGRFLVTDPQFWQREHLGLVPTEIFMRQNNIGNGIIAFNPNAIPTSYGRTRVLKQFLRETGCALPAITQLARQIINFDCPGDGLISSLIEQVPDPNNRVTLMNDVDACGVRRVQLNWQLAGPDLHTLRVLAVEAAKDMARLNLARVQLSPFILDSGLKVDVGGHAHQMGTTRMSANPRDGVVDENCQVYGVDNLFIAGSSVFPTGGGTNPTLTIALLAVRLGEFLGSTT